MAQPHPVLPLNTSLTEELRTLLASAEGEAAALTRLAALHPALPAAMLRNALEDLARSTWRSPQGTAPRPLLAALARPALPPRAPR